MSYKQNIIIETKKKDNNLNNDIKIIQTNKKDKSKSDSLFKPNIVQTPKKSNYQINKEKIDNAKIYKYNKQNKTSVYNIYELLSLREDVYIKNLTVDDAIVINKITNTTVPTNPEDLTNKAYVDLVAGGGAPIDASFVTVGLNPNLTNERVLTGTVRNINLTDGGPNSNISLSIPDDLFVIGPTKTTIPIPGATMTSNLLLGYADFRSDTQTRNIVNVDGLQSVLSGINDTNIYNGNIRTNSDSQNVNCITTGNNVLNGIATVAVFVGNNSITSDDGFAVNSLIVGNQNNINTRTLVENSTIMGANHSFTGLTFAYSRIFQSFISGNAVSVTSDANLTNSFITGNNIAISQNITNSFITGQVHTISGPMVSGANILGYGITNSGTLTASSLIGSFINKSGQARVNIFGDNHENTVTESAGNRRGMVLATGFPDASSLYYKAGGSLTTNTNWGATAGEDIVSPGSPLNGNGNLHFISNNTYFGGRTDGTTYFRDRRPRCQESLYPTTNDNDLTSKAYVDASTFKVINFTNGQTTLNSSNFIGWGRLSSLVGSASFPISFSGTLNEIYASCFTAPGTGENYRLELYENTIATGTFVEITGTNTTQTATAVGFTITAGNLYTVRVIYSAGASAAGNVFHFMSNIYL